MKKMLLTAALSVSCLVPAAAEDWGTVTGQFVVTGDIPALELMHDPKADIRDKAVCAAVNPFKEDLIIDKESRGLANVFVYLVKAPKSIHPDLKNPEPAKLVLDQKGCMFIPHAMVVRGGQTVEVISSDAIAHTVNYSTACAYAEEIASGHPFNLIEALAGEIADILLAKFAVEQVRVLVRKPAALARRGAAYAAVELVRKRNA